MKFQPRRFVVEVKRGTSRAAFTSPDTVSHKFSSAEELLFGSAHKKISLTPAPQEPSLAKPSGRILKSLIEPPPPVPDEVTERPRRGRKPGSKNKPRLSQAASPAASLPPAKPVAGPAQRGAPEGVSGWRAAPGAVEAPSPMREAPSDPETTAPLPARPSRLRLRDRSTIIKRYVLATEPLPGQPGWLRARRAARKGR